MAEFIFLPKDWHLEVQKRLARKDRWSLFCTCVHMRDMVLANHHVTLTLMLSDPPCSASSARLSLVLACRHARDVTLHFQPGCSPPVDTTNPSSVERTCHAVLYESMQQVSLHSVTQAKLQGFPMRRICPLWLLSSCQRLTTLINCCTITNTDMATASVSPAEQRQPTAGALPPPAGQLRELQLLGQELQHVPDWQHQLNQLTGLESLTVVAHSLGFLQHVAALHASLTQITLRSGRHEDPRATTPLRPLPPTQLITTWLTHLTELHLPNTVMDDALMDNLLNNIAANRLNHLTCGQGALTQSYRHRPAPWKRLSVIWYDPGMLRDWPMEGVQLVPLQEGCNITLFDWCGGDTVGFRWADASAVREVADMLRDAQGTAGLTSSGSTPSCAQVGVDAGGVRGAVVAATAPARSHWAERCEVLSHLMGDFRVVAAALQVVGVYRPRHLVLDLNLVHSRLVPFLTEHLQGVEEVWVKRAEVLPEVWCQLLPALPDSVVCVQFLQYCVLTEDHLATLCEYACRPVQVVVHGCARWKAGWQDRVREVMQAAGHDHVTLEG